MTSSNGDKRGSVHGALEHRPDGWWVVGFDCGAMGPYATKEAADSDRQGVERWYRTEWREKQRALPALDDVNWEAGQNRLFD